MTAKYTIDEYIDVVKYHGHQYDMSIFEILEDIKEQMVETDNEFVKDQELAQLEREEVEDKLEKAETILGALNEALKEFEL